jgi:hypothetical protein
MAEPKTRPTDQSADTFLASIPGERRRHECRIVLELMQEAAEAEAEMWGSSIVGFGRYRQAYADGKEREWPIIGFSPRKNELTLYLLLGDGEADSLLSRLGKHKVGKACLYIRRIEDVDLGVLKALIEDTVRKMSAQRVDR